MKKLAILAMLALGILPVAAQDTAQADSVVYNSNKYQVETNRFWSNWFFSVGVGGQVYFGDYDSKASCGGRVSPSLDIAVGKWFSPGIGVRLMYNGLFAKGVTPDANGEYGPHSTGRPIDGKMDEGVWMTKTHFKYFNLQGDVLFNLTNLIMGYKEKRVYNCSPYLGVGVFRVIDDPTSTSLSGHFGVLNTFRLCSALDINLDVRGTLVSDDTDGEIGGSAAEGMASITVGLTYKIGKSNWNRSKTVSRTVFNNDEINALRDKINMMSQENERLQKVLAQQEREKAQTVDMPMASSYLIVFEIGKSRLTHESRVNLGMMAENIKQGDSSAVYTIVGYADAGTGSKAGNERLSKARAEAVHKCLVEEFGVDAKQLKIDYKGGVENMFYDDPCMSRAVIMKNQ